MVNTFHLYMMLLWERLDPLSVQKGLEGDRFPPVCQMCDAFHIFFM